MAGFDPQRLVLIESRTKNVNSYGTGYFVTDELVLTASHVFSEGLPDELTLRIEGAVAGRESHWVEGEKIPVWKDTRLDAALIRVVQGLPDGLPPVEWGETSFETNQEWTSVAYPKVASEKTGDGTIFKTSGLEGTLYAHGGGGQGQRELDLGVQDHAELWNGISGAPVFVGGKLVGIIKTSHFEQRRLAAVPIDILRRDPAFRLALARPWLQPYPEGKWVLVLRGETGKGVLESAVKAAIERREEYLRPIVGKDFDTQPDAVTVTEALESPERFFQLVKAICAAPVMVFDVTGFEPAVMLFLGIRAVVRRGVTLTTTNEPPEETSLSALPFNIQETKLIYLSATKDVTQPKHRFNLIGTAILNGLTQLKSHPTYQDLPAYDAVRCPEPKSADGLPLTSDNILMLCSFHAEYQKNWLDVSEKIAELAARKTLERMLDIASPRLVGLALYEAIRWTPCCIVDWTGWRANVFFELGVRLACSDIGPIGIVDAKELAEPGATDQPGVGGAEETGHPLQKQKGRLIQLLKPTVYELNGSGEPFEEAFRRYFAVINNDDTPVDDSTIAHNAIYQVIVNSYVWQQEPISKLPHEELRDKVQANVGKDPQKEGSSQLLYASNAEFAKSIARSVQERWIAAWFYLRGRHTKEEVSADAQLRKELITLGEEAALWLSKAPEYKRIYQEILDEIDILEDQ